MPNDMYTINALSKELSDELVGGKIEKINQPEKDEVVFYVHKNGKNKILVVSVNANSPRIHITNEKKDNPYVAPPFLMHLRRRFMGARIEKFECVGFDRVIRLDVKGRNEMSDETSDRIYIELLGRYSNIIVCDENDIISEALRHITPENSFRCILPRVKYELPPLNKLSPVDPEIINVLREFSGGDLPKFLSAKVAGFSLATACEVIYRAHVDDYCDALSEDDRKRIFETVKEFFNVNSSPIYSPQVKYENGVPVDFFVTTYRSLSADMRPAGSLNEAVKICAIEKDRSTRLLAEGKNLTSALKNAIKKHERNLETAKQKIKECENFDELRILGELITNNIYLLKKGDTFLTTLNYYTNENVTIPLDKTLTPQQNAQAYYKKYSKQKRTIVICEKQVEDLASSLDYLYSIKTALDLAENAQELVEIKEELISIGLIKEKPQKGKVRNPKTTPPKEYRLDGFKIIRGRNNVENERITFGMSAEHDVWLHTKDSHGSHVLIKTEGKKVPDNVLKCAAEIAAYYSEKQRSGNTVVDHTLKKFVKKRPNAGKGAVIYTDYQGIVVMPDPHKDLETN